MTSIIRFNSTKIINFNDLRIMNNKTKTTILIPISKQSGTKVFLLAFFLLCMASGCSRPIQPQSDFITIELGERTFIRYFDPVQKTTYEENEVIRLSDFIDSAMTDYPQIYAYRIIGSDGYYPAKKGVPDNIWEELQKGYLKLNTKEVVFDSTLNLPRKYNVNDVVTISLLRKINTKLKQEGDLSFSLIDDMNFTTYVDSADAFYNGRSVVRLTDFVTPVTYTPEDYNYNLISAQGKEKTFTWPEIQTGWWLLDLDLTKFSPDLGTESRISYLQTIELIPKPE